MRLYQKKEIITEVGDLNHIKPYDLNHVLKKRIGQNWLYAFETGFGAVNMVFEKIKEKEIKKYYGEDQGFFECYNLLMLINGEDIKINPDFKIELEIYNRILKTCLSETIFFLNTVHPKSLFINGVINLDHRKNKFTTEQVEEFKRQMKIKFQLYGKIIKQNISLASGYIVQSEDVEGILIQRSVTNQEEEQAKLNRLDRKGLLEGYINKLLKEINTL